MRLLSILIIVLASTVANAGTINTELAKLPREFNVYSSQSSGTKDTVCRSILDIYSKKFNAIPVIIVKKGAGGTIAMEEMLKDKKFSVLCSGPSESIYNITVFPGHEKEYKMLTMVIILAIGPTTIYTKTDGKFNSINDLQKKSFITVGFNAQGPRSIAEIIFQNKDVVWVPFINSVDSLSSLMDGSLDVYIDSGSLEEMARANKIKSLGHFGGTPDLLGSDLGFDFPQAAKLPAFVALTTSINNSLDDIEQLNVELRSIINSAEYAIAIAKIGWVPVSFTVKNSNELAEQFKSLLKK